MLLHHPYVVQENYWGAWPMQSLKGDKLSGVKALCLPIT